MKVYRHLFEKICTIENFRIAYANAIKGKGFYKEVKEINKDPETYLQNLLEEVKSGQYRVSDYIIFTRFTGGKEREIYKLPMKDRIVQHAIMIYLEPIFRENFILDTYASIKTRGIHLGLTRVKRALKDDGYKYAMKLDIHKCYPSLDQEILKMKLREKIKDAPLIRLLDIIIDSCESGVPIGNYTSQYFNNFYFSAFDHWIKEQKKVKYYFRYCDDMVLFGRTKEELFRLLKEIQEYMASLHVELKPNYQIFPIDVRGIDFLGYVSRRKYIKSRKHIKLNFQSKVEKMNFEKLKDRDINILGSYWGIFVHADCRHLWQVSTGFKDYKTFRQFLKEKRKEHKNKIKNDMKWYKGNSEAFEQIVSVGKGVSEVRLSLKHIDPVPATETDGGDPSDLLYVKGTIKGNLSTAAVKQLLYDLQKEYDKSIYVNSFIIRGQKAWLSKADRVGLTHSLQVQKDAGLEQSTLWLNGKSYSVNIDYLLSFLKELELYAIQCYNITQEHLRAINSMNGRTEILAHDITAGYPSPIRFDDSKIS